MGSFRGVFMIRFPEDDDVISFNPGNISGHATYKSINIKTNFKNFLQQSQQNSVIPYATIFSQGIGCEVMTTDRIGWRKAKLVLKFHLEFEDEPEP